MKEAVLLTYMGAPSSLEEIKPFLYRLFSDRDLINFGVPAFLQKPLAYLISTFRTPKVRPQYEAIGGGSPLVRNSLEQAKLLEERLGIKTFCGMLYSEPLLEKVARELLRYSPDVVYHLTLYPQFSYSTVAPCERDARKFLKSLKLLTVRSWCRNENYLRWIRDSLAPYLHGKDPFKTALLFSAHSVPKYFVEKFKDPYPKEVAETVRGAAEPFK
jgi:ferrochelatase